MIIGDYYSDGVKIMLKISDKPLKKYGFRRQGKLKIGKTRNMDSKQAFRDFIIILFKDLMGKHGWIDIKDDIGIRGRGSATSVPQSKAHTFFLHIIL